MSSPRILVVEDNPVIRKALEYQLGVAGYEVVGAGSSSEAIQAAAARKPDLVILDLTLNEDGAFDSIRDGFAVLGWLRRVLPDASFPVIIHTVDHSPRVDERARAEGIYAVFRKGEGMRKLLDAVQQALTAGDAKAPASN